MHADSRSPLTVRDAEAVDIPALTAIKGAGSDVLHCDRLDDAQRSDIRYLVLVVNQAVRGCCLINLSVLQEAEKGRPHLPAPEALLGIPLSAGLPMFS